MPQAGACVQSLTSINLNNAVVVVGLSLVAGAILGYISGKVGAALKKG
jgi:ABC-type dipeptide/oligopeptide/nickel transport system permease subunit